MEKRRSGVKQEDKEEDEEEEGEVEQDRAAPWIPDGLLMIIIIILNTEYCRKLTCVTSTSQKTHTKHWLYVCCQ